MNYSRLFFIIIVLLFITNAAECSLKNTTGTKRRLTPNRIGEIVLKRLKNNLIKRQIEPLSIPGVGPFGEGQFVGLTSIRRIGVTTVLNRNQSVEITAMLSGGDQTKLTFPCNMRFLGRSLCNKGATLGFDGLSLYLVVKVRSTEDGHPQLEICDVQDLGQVTLRFGDEGPLGSVLSWASSWISSLMKSRVGESLEDVLCNAVASNLT